MPGHAAARAMGDVAVRESAALVIETGGPHPVVDVRCVCCLNTTSFFFRSLELPQTQKSALRSEP